MVITADYRNAFTDKMRIRYRMRYIVQPYNRTAQPRCYHNTFYGRPFREPRRGGHSNWQSGASESATKYVLLLVWVFATDCSNAEFCASCVCVYVCVRTCVWERDRETGSHHVSYHNCGLCAKTSSLCLSRDCSPFGLELVLNLRTLLTVFTFNLKAEARDYGKGRYIVVFSQSMHWVSWPIGADWGGGDWGRL